MIFQCFYCILDNAFGSLWCHDENANVFCSVHIFQGIRLQEIELRIFVLGHIGLGQKQSKIERFGPVQVSFAFICYLFLSSFWMWMHTSFLVFYPMNNFPLKLEFV